MENAIAEMPLAVFTTLASIGAGAFIALAVALFTARFSEAQLAKIDKMTVVPFLVAAVGFLASVFHLTNPLNGINVFAGLGSSGLSNEVCAGILFMVVALVYVIMGLAGKLGGARKPFAAVVAVLAAIFVCLVGVLYLMPTVQSWNTPATPVQMIGYALLGGTALAALVVALASDGKAPEGLKAPFVGLSVVGAVLAVVALLIQIALVNGMANAAVSGASLVSSVVAFAVIAVIGIVAAAVIMFKQLSAGKLTVAGMGAATIVAIVAVLCARIVFYALELSVGLAL